MSEDKTIKGLLERLSNDNLPLEGRVAILQTLELKEISKQLTRIADSIEKVTCQDCCKTAGEKIIKDKSGKEWEVPEEFKSTKKGE